MGTYIFFSLFSILFSFFFTEVSNYIVYFYFHRIRFSYSYIHTYTFFSLFGFTFTCTHLFSTTYVHTRVTVLWKRRWFSSSLCILLLCGKRLSPPNYHVLPLYLNFHFAQNLLDGGGLSKGLSVTISPPLGECSHDKLLPGGEFLQISKS